MISVGCQIGHYQIIDDKPIGRGSFSHVYKAKNMNIESQSQSFVAIKIISLTDMNKMVDRLKYEIAVMKTLNHKNIIHMSDVIYQNDYIYLVLDYCKNGDLHKFLNGRPLKEKYARFYLKQMADALKYLYDRNIIHRDLKPQNLLLSDTYSLKITDFGFAKYFDQGGMSETICGTPLYMAPEIMQFKKYSIKSDLWSVGIILYEMIVGRTPYKAANHMELLHKINTQSVIIPASLNISESCKSLISGLIQKNPKDRLNWAQFFIHNWIVDDIVSIDINVATPSDNLFSIKSNLYQSMRIIDDYRTPPNPPTNTPTKTPKTTFYPSPSRIIKDDVVFEPYSDDDDADNEDNGNDNTNDNDDDETDDCKDDDDNKNNESIITTNDNYYSIAENFQKKSVHEDKLSLSGGDEDVIIEQRTGGSTPIPIQGGGRGMDGTRSAAYSLQSRKELFMPIVSSTPKKDNGFVIVETPKEYDLVSDILKNEKRNLSESLMDYMNDTYYYLRSFVKKSWK